MAKINPVLRLKILRNFLAKVNPHRFEMEVFKERSACGTHMCVAGHMASIPFFKRLGYKLKKDNWGDFEPYKDGEFGPKALREALGISLPDVIALCYRWNCIEHHGQPALDGKLAQVDELIEKYSI